MTDYIEGILDSVRVWLYTPSRLGSGDAGGWISSWTEMVRLEKDHTGTGWKTGLGTVILFGWILVLLLAVGWYFTHHHCLGRRTITIPDPTWISDLANGDGCTQIVGGGEVPPIRGSSPWLGHHPQSNRVLTPNPSPQTPLPPRSEIGIPHPRTTSNPSSHPAHHSNINKTRTQIPNIIPPHILLLHYIYPNSSYWPAHYLRAFRLAVESASAHLDSDSERSRASHTDAPVSANTRTRGKDGKRWNGRVVLSRKRVEEDLRSGEVGLRRGVGGLVRSLGIMRRWGVADD
jgi:hypothetical protein